jgi:hypothetical protein
VEVRRRVWSCPSEMDEMRVWDGSGSGVGARSGVVKGPRLERIEFG